jgi:hypothetical protein
LSPSKMKEVERALLISLGFWNIAKLLRYFFIFD